MDICKILPRYTAIRIRRQGCATPFKQVFFLDTISLGACFARFVRYSNTLMLSLLSLCAAPMGAARYGFLSGK